MKTLTIDGEEITLDRDSLEIRDLDDDMTKAAAQMAYWGGLWGTAEGEKSDADTAYRTWRAEYGKQVLEADPKLAEWKVKQQIEASKKFTTHKERMSESIRNASVLRAMYESFRAKCSLLQSKGAMARAELEATGMSTKRRGSDDPGERKKKEDVIRNAKKKRKAARVDDEE